MNEHAIIDYGNVITRWSPILRSMDIKSTVNGRMICIKTNSKDEYTAALKSCKHREKKQKTFFNPKDCDDKSF